MKGNRREKQAKEKKEKKEEKIEKRKKKEKQIFFPSLRRQWAAFLGA